MWHPLSTLNIITLRIHKGKGQRNKILQKMSLFLPLVFVTGIIISGRRNSSTCILSLVSLPDVSVPSFKSIASASSPEAGLDSGSAKYQTMVELTKKWQQVPTIMDKSLGHLCNVTNYLCLTNEVWKKRCYHFKSALPLPFPTQHNVDNQVKLQVIVFNIAWWVRGEVRQVKSYSHLACVQKCQKCKAVDPKTFVLNFSL